MATISDKKQLGVITPCLAIGFDGHCLGYGPPEVQDYFGADVVTANDYYPFGMAMPGRKYSAGGEYRYGFNGKEKSNEIYGEGNVYDYGFRIYNPKLGKFLSVDPLTESYPYYSSYQFAGNMPIAAIDLDGLEQYVVIYYKDEHGFTTSIQVRAITDNEGNVLNQHIHKASDTKDVAKGNVLVFEAYQLKNGYENLKVVDDRNTPMSKLTSKELAIYNKHKELEKEGGETQTLTYGERPNGKSAQYVSQDFDVADTKTFNSMVDIPLLANISSIHAEFDIGTTDINNKKEVMKQIKPFVDALKNNPKIQITLSGNVYADPIWVVDTKNKVYMIQKAEAVKKLLVSQGANSNQIKTAPGVFTYNEAKATSIDATIKR